MNTITRRDFLRSSLVGSAGAVLVGPVLHIGGQPAAAEGLCVTLCNHWSYIGIGWQLGLESCVLSVTDAMEMADRPPGVKTCLNLDARAYEFMAERFPEAAERLKKYLAAGKVELIGGTYGQPMGTTISGESNIRQVVYGRETIRKALGYEMETFLEEEEFSHPQVPQIIAGAGYRYASLAQVDTWGRAGVPLIELNAMLWQGKDGTTIPCIPKNSLFGYSPDLKQLAASPAFKKLQALGKPLIFTWEEFGWEPPELPTYLTAPAKYQKFADESPVEFVTLKEYLDKYGARPRETICLKMDAWNKSLTWGLGGDQLRALDRQVEALLLAAERFDGIACILGAESKPQPLDIAWKHLLAAQSHDVGLCEYSRWQGDRMAPVDRIEDRHNFTWGAIGYNHLDAARGEGQVRLDAALNHIGRRIGSQSKKPGRLVVTVFNPCAWERDDVVLTGRIDRVQPQTNGIVVKDRAGRVVPSQLIKSEKDGSGRLAVAEVAFVAERVPSMGYDTYYLELTPEPQPATATDLIIDEPDLALENEHLKIKLDPTTGAIRSLLDKRTGREILAGTTGAFPVFKGKPNPNYALRSIFGSKNVAMPPQYDSATSKAEILWLERGPVRATVKARHKWPLLQFETHVSLQARLPYVQVLSRVLAEVPPVTDTSMPDIKEGYWLCFAPSFQPVSVIRDFPLAIEPTDHSAFHALTFVDLMDKEVGLLLLHAGTQYFNRDAQGMVANLLMREWESYWTGEYGWPRYAEYRHALMPHRAEFTNAERTRAAAEFSQKLIAMVSSLSKGNLPTRKSFVAATPSHVQVSAFRRKERSGYELRVIEVEGREADAAVEFAFPVRGAVETNLLGHKVADVSRKGSQLRFKIRPWQIRTFELHL